MVWYWSQRLSPCLSAWCLWEVIRDLINPSPQYRQLTLSTASMHGLGQHSADLIDAGIDVTHIIEFVWAGHILYSFAIAFAKLSIISSYFRIFPHHRLHKLMYVLLAITLALLAASVVATVFICLPIQAAWDPAIRPQATCYRFPSFLYASTTINMITDVVLCTAPLPYFLRLRLPRKQKVGACLLFIVGGS